MWETFAILLIPAMLVTIIGKSIFNKNIDNKEFAMSFGFNVGAALFGIMIISLIQSNRMSDVEIWNGLVTGKQRNVVSCSHSYRCNCYTTCSGTGNNRTCTEYCSTCYDHSYDVDWDVYTSVGDYTIDRIDSQGVNEPERWTIVKPNEPVAREKSYQNPLLLDKESSLFVVDSKLYNQSESILPDYPSTYDYWKINRVIGHPIALNANDIKHYLDEYLKLNGGRKQLNIIAVFTLDHPEYFNALMSKWNGGKKNDVILVYGLDKSGVVKWFNSNSYAKGMNNREMHTLLRQAALGEKITMDVLTKQVGIIDNKFNRISTEEFAYKKEQAEIPTVAVVILFILNLLVSVGVMYLFNTNQNVKNWR